MSRLAVQIWVAVIAGSAVSAALFYLAYATRSTALTTPQFIGFYLCMLLRGGIHSATKMDYALIALPINAAIYAGVIFALFRLVKMLKHF